MTFKYNIALKIGEGASVFIGIPIKFERIGFIMIKVVIVEDNAHFIDLIKQYLQRFQQEKNILFDVSVFTNGLNFIDEYTAGADIIFMDIEMPLMNGLEAAKKLRERDTEVCLVFITMMAQLAVKGYSVDAVDFIVKPIDYFEFSLKMEKFLRKIPRKDCIVLNIRNENGIFRIKSKDIYYVETLDHCCVFHTEKVTLQQRITLKKVEALLRPEGFLRCNQSYLVNPAHISRLQTTTVTVGETELIISRPKRKAFLAAAMKYLGEHD